ncbi:FAD:protein FMN transferase [Pontibacter sp. G13]|uniref:FAD:protein FMN transferase n=1 Tax=Pontibacter sp. G13 TaxID=3074898 RepID=UPI00288BE5F5|nr:FAD:protein FMN transferase [Pontibacter sp. G13]WNJ19662.1 FAD:protein FMN transferase [Pontibacter sp. G13]
MANKLTVCSLILMGWLSHGLWAQGSTAFKADTSLILMGTAFSLTAYGPTDDIAHQGIRTGVKEVQRIERMISSWDPKSETSAIHAAAGKHPVKVSPELFRLIQRSIKVSQLTQGAFDISFASIQRIWYFDRPMERFPDSQQVAESVAHIGYERIQLDPEQSTVFLPDSLMRLGFGAIGKGYAANRAKAEMEKMGITIGLVNASGDLICWGNPPEGSWRIGIAHPRKPGKMLTMLEVSDQAVVTSGDYEDFFEWGGIRYSHIIDPRTGFPTHGAASVTVICPNAELADALATSVSVLGPKAGLALINQLKGIECLIVTDSGAWYSSNGLNLDE